MMDIRRRLFPARLRGNRARLAPARCGALHVRHATWQTPVCPRRGRAHPALASDGHGASSPIPANFAHCPVTGGGRWRHPSAPRTPQSAPPRLAASAGPVRGSSGIRLPPSRPAPVGHSRSIGGLPSAHATLGSLRRHPPPCEKTARRFLFRAMDCQSFASFRRRDARVPHAAGRFCAIAQGRRGPCAGAESRLGSFRSKAAIPHSELDLWLADSRMCAPPKVAARGVFLRTTELAGAGALANRPKFRDLRVWESWNGEMHLVFNAEFAMMN